MRILFLHDCCPGQFGPLAEALAAEPDTDVVFATADRPPEQTLTGVRLVRYRPSRPVGDGGHHYLRWLEGAVLTGQAVWRLCRGLAAEGFVPDVVCAHSGWGPALYVKEALPDTRLVGYFEWYYHTCGGDADFRAPLEADDACRLVTRNAALLLDLAACDAGLVPTVFQRDQFPVPFRDRLTVLHDGIDTAFFAPGPPEALPGLPLLPPGADVVTYATRGMEPYRGFPEFLHAVARLQRERPALHAVIAGTDTVVYGRQPDDGRSWKTRLLEDLADDLDLTRLHFTGPLPLPAYRALLRRSSVHVYLTVPFVLSWSLLEALSTGCLVVGSDTPPVREVLTDGVNGLLSPFPDAPALAARIASALDLPPAQATAIKATARATVVDRYDLRDLLPRRMAVVRGEERSWRQDRVTR